MRKLLHFAALILLAIWVFQNPAQAGHDVKHAMHDISTFASSL